MKINKNTKVKVTYQPELGTGEVLQVEETSGGEYQVDVVFEKDGRRFLETFPQGSLTPVADIFQRYQNGESDHPTDFFIKQLAYQLPLENSGGELTNSKTDLLPHQILLTHQIISLTSALKNLKICNYSKLRFFPSLYLIFILHILFSLSLFYGVHPKGHKGKYALVQVQNLV